MSTDLTITDPNANLHAQMEFARSVAGSNDPREMAKSMLPEAYRGHPANVLVAVGLGQAMGLSFAESLYRIAVIKGKPSASAELIASNVRRAGHKLRVKVSENPPVATCTIIRADDPDEPTTITRDMAWAERMGLQNEPNYRKQPATMLSYRAISACARLACPEALYGVTYTPDEAASIDDGPRPAARATAASFIPHADAGTVVATVEAERPGDVDGGDPISDRTRRKMFALLAKVDPNADDDPQRKGMSLVLGREVTSRADLTEDDAHAVIAALQAELDRRDTAQTGGE